MSPSVLFTVLDLILLQTEMQDEIDHDIKRETQYFTKSSQSKLPLITVEKWSAPIKSAW